MLKKKDAVFITSFLHFFQTPYILKFRCCRSPRLHPWDPRATRLPVDGEIRASGLVQSGERKEDDTGTGKHSMNGYLRTLFHPDGFLPQPCEVGRGRGEAPSWAVRRRAALHTCPPRPGCGPYGAAWHRISLRETGNRSPGCVRWAWHPQGVLPPGGHRVAVNGV